MDRLECVMTRKSVRMFDGRDRIDPDRSVPIICDEERGRCLRPGDKLADAFRTGRS